MFVYAERAAVTGVTDAGQRYENEAGDPGRGLHRPGISGSLCLVDVERPRIVRSSLDIPYVGKQCKEADNDQDGSRAR